jgi:ankyrin repeat protein
MVCANGHEKLLDELLSRDTKMLNSQNNDGNTPLHWAIINNHLKIVKKLV